MKPYKFPSSGIFSPRSPPASPRTPNRSPRHRRAAKPVRPASKSLVQRLGWFLLSLLLKSQGLFLFAPLLYLSAKTVSYDIVPVVKLRHTPGSVYRSPQLYAKLRSEMDSDNSSVDAVKVISSVSDFELLAIPTAHLFNAINGIFHLTCRYPVYGKTLIKVVNGDHASKSHQESLRLPESNGYIFVEANGGLNQQRTSICNAVAVAAYLNATLIVPYFHFHSIWRDSSKFSDIYDEELFIKMLETDVRIVKTIPGNIMERFDYNLSNVYNFRIQAWSSINYYKDTVLPKLLEEKIIRLSPFANRLSTDAPPAVQRLRCLANYQALKFADPISALGELLDMVAFSCCVYDGGVQEKLDMVAARERGWKGKFTKPGRIIIPGAIRLNGSCPLTPLEVGLMLRGMGFGKSTSIYLASGKIYNSEKYMAPLLEMFPLLQTKETLASAEELAPFENYSSRMAAIDYTVCLHSEVFVPTQGGNFLQLLLGHRRYLYGGHSRTIRPDKRKLALLFDNPNTGWKNFKKQMVNMRANSVSKGLQLKRPSDSIYSFPCPDCMCKADKSENARSSLPT
ncbi:hypothetical protein SASPL_128461 [Salvia splendens]|uniref:O-fucosyltransferase family protein n=1 Tax=Salvia splendens TaxID=180675 RepID=A0A8X8ZM39_SALSN|nr:hypothetical protein SASPL_128461 [Salvia splendens]